MNPLTSIARTRIIADVLAWLLLGVKLKDLAEALSGDEMFVNVAPPSVESATNW